MERCKSLSELGVLVVVVRDCHGSDFVIYDVLKTF